jgi:hypothetical protein
MMIWSVDDDGRFTTLKRIPLKPALKPTDLVVVHADLRDMAAMADELVTKLPELGLNVRLVNELITDQIVVAISPKPIVYGDVRKVLNLEPEPLDEAIDAIAAMMKLMSPHEGLEIDRSAPELTESVERLLEAGVKFSEDVVRVICWPHPENEPQSEILRELETHADYEKLDGFLESYYRGMSI